MNEEVHFINVDFCEDYFVFLEVYNLNIVVYGRASFDKEKFVERFGPAALKKLGY